MTAKYILPLIMVGLVFAIASRSEARTVKRKAQRKARVQFRVPVTSKMISTAEIRRAVVDGFRSYLGELKGGMHTTRGEWNRIDARTISLKKVTIDRGTRDRFGYKLRSGEQRLDALLTVKQGEGRRKKTTTVRLKSVINLDPRGPTYGTRVKGTPEMQARDANATKRENELTVSWID